MHWPGIEPGSPAWEARILPLNHQCLPPCSSLTALREELLETLENGGGEIERFQNGPPPLPLEDRAD